MLYGSDYPCRGESSSIRLLWVCLLYLYLVCTSSGLIAKGDSITLESRAKFEIQLQHLMKVLYIPTVCMLHLLQLI